MQMQWAPVLNDMGCRAAKRMPAEQATKQKPKWSVMKAHQFEDRASFACPYMLIMLMQLPNLAA